MFLTLLVFFITLSILILVHELGHFLAAKKGGIKVEEFGLGYPPRLLSKKIGKTIYSLNLIPFGGFVRLFGQEEVDHKDKKGAFWAKPKRTRLAVIWAGVLSNVFLGWLLFSVIYTASGIPTETNKVIIAGVNPDSPAAAAGLQAEDVVRSLDNEGLTSIDDFIDKVGAKKGEEVSLGLERKGQEVVVKLTPRQQHGEDEGPLGVVISSFEMKKYSWWQMPYRSGVEGAKETFFWTKMVVGGVFKMLKDLLLAGQVPTEIAGPIGILQISGHVARSGFLAVLQFIAILSVNLAVINVLPFPGLDGGHFAFLVVEAVTGRRSHKNLQRWVQTLGIAFLIFLMVMVTVNDINRILTTTEIGERLRSFWPF